jgi:predicted dehydrogenase
LAGKHVLVEKPIAVDLAEAAEIVALAGRSPGHLVCAPHVTLSPVYRDIARLIEEGKIGRPLSARGLYGWAGPDWTSWFYAPGGGPLFDLGVYNATTLTGLLGPVRRVAAMGAIAIPERVVDNRRIAVSVEDNVHVTLDFGDGCLATIATGFTLQKYRVPGIEIYGSGGTVQMIGEDWAPRGYELWRNDRGCWEIHEGGGGWRWTDGIRDLVEAVLDDREPASRAEHAYHVLEVLTKANEAMRSGRTVAVTSSFELPRVEPEGARISPHLIHAPS